MALTPGLVAQGDVTPTTFSDHATLSINVGSGAGRAIFVFAILDANGSGTTFSSCRVGSTAGVGGTVMSAGSAGSFNGLSTWPTMLFTLIPTTETGSLEVWLQCSDGNRKPGIKVVVVQDSLGRTLTAGDFAIANATISGAAAASLNVSTLGTGDADGIVFLQSDGFTLGTASAGSTALCTGQTNSANYTIEAFYGQSTGSSISVGWQPGSGNQNQTRHSLSLTAASGGGGGGVSEPPVRAFPRSILLH